MKQHILVVDDEKPVRDLIELYLRRHDYEVSVAHSSAEALALLERQRVDLVVLDIGLADEDGLQVLTELKARHPNTRVVMLTGMGFVEDLLEEAQRKGADGYVSKVLPLDELALAIRRTLSPAPAGPAAQY